MPARGDERVRETCSFFVIPAKAGIPLVFEAGPPLGRGVTKKFL
jgi:hypothetical protein